MAKSVHRDPLVHPGLLGPLETKGKLVLLDLQDLRVHQALLDNVDLVVIQELLV